jgi:phage terminase small subunit
MSRKSAAALTVVPFRPAPRLRPPDDLTEAERAIWRQITESLPPERFHASDTPLLRSYVVASARVVQAGERLRRGAVRAGKVSPWFGAWERALRLQLSLARSLRLLPSARLDRTVAGRHARRDSSAQPWTFGTPRGKTDE